MSVREKHEKGTWVSISVLLLISSTFRQVMSSI